MRWVRLAVPVAVVGAVAWCLVTLLNNANRFQCKTFQGLAKVSLSSIHTAEHAFHDEWGYYTTDLVALGLDSSNAMYVIGFAVPSSEPGSDGKAPPGHDPARKDSFAAFTKSSQSQRLGAEGRRQSELPPDTTATKGTFRAVAIGNPDMRMFERILADGDPDLDIWTIDEKRQLTSVQNDCDRVW